MLRVSRYAHVAELIFQADLNPLFVHVVAQNAAGQWPSMPCEERSNGCVRFPSSHRCIAKVSEGRFYETNPNDRFCGRVFCLICAEARGLPHNTLMCDHHFPGDSSQLVTMDI